MIPKPTHESSKYYFLTEEGIESFNKTTGLNYQSDDFFHSVYVTSSFFNVIQAESDLIERAKDVLPFVQKTEKDKKDVYKKLLEEIKKHLEIMRKPYLKKLSHEKITEWKKEDILPEVKEFGLDQKQYERIIKEVYVAVPQLFKGNDDQRKLILRLFPALLSSEEKGYVLKILDQVYTLSPEEKKILSELLERTTLSNITRTIKEIDDRMNILSVLEKILFDKDVNKYTKEVVHLQKILDESFWIFGEDYRLLASAEGSIKKTLISFKDKILRKEDVKIENNSRKEIDIFLAKVDQTSQKVSCVVVEIKRPSVKLGKKQYDQIYEYMDRDEEKRKTFFKLYNEIEMLYEIISPDAFLRPYIDKYITFSSVYQVVRNAYTDHISIDREFQKKTAELVREHIQSSPIKLGTELVQLDEKGIQLIKDKNQPDEVKIINLIKSIQKLAEEKSNDPVLISVKERAENIMDAYSSRQMSTQEALKQLLALLKTHYKIQGNVNRKDLKQ